MSNFLYANKADRNAAFHFANGGDDAGLDGEVNGDQSARLHPTPANLGNAQKLTPVDQEPAPLLRPIEVPRTY